ncbi:MAG TPA: tetratricopeptide repeat protein [Rickettsiales bacterium]|nr:tetratricopeptide repeat protein [Rickettsiales bacterium]
MRNAQNKTLSSGDPIAVEAARAVSKYLMPADIHEAKREKSSGYVALITGIILCPLEFFLLYGVLTHEVSVLLGFILHVAIVLALAFCVYVMSQGAEKKFVFLLLISVMTTGPFGAAGTILTVLTHLWYTQHAMAFEEWFSSIFPKQPQTTAQRIHENILTGRDEAAQQYSVISFMDVISFGSEAQKRQALSKATSNFQPNFAPLFHKALRDHSNTIRVLAATGISKIESQFLERMMQLTELKSVRSKDPLVVWAVAEHYDNYAYTGLLDFDRELNNRQKALAHYQEYLQLKPDDIEARNRIGRILMRNKEYEKACEWLHKCIAQGYSSESISQWYSEALFACGRYEDLRRYRSGVVLPQSGNQNTTLRDALALWSGSKV